MARAPSVEDIGRIIERAGELGLQGWAGECGSAALAINQVLFAGRGVLVAGLNEVFWGVEQPIGHVAVRVEHPELGVVFWDADGQPKQADDILSWGMLDASDADWIERALDCGFELDTAGADKAVLVEMSPEQVRLYFRGRSQVEAYAAALRMAARERHQAQLQAAQEGPECGTYPRARCAG